MRKLAWKTWLNVARFLTLCAVVGFIELVRMVFGKRHSVDG